MERARLVVPPIRPGFTLVELIVTLAILAVLIGAGLPAMVRFLAELELRTAQDRLFIHLATARTVAITEGRRAALCPSVSGVTCSGRTDWNSGWMVFVDTDGNRERGPAERAVAVGALPESVRLVSSRARRVIRFLPDGRSPGSNLTFRLCSTHPIPGRAIILSNTGRARASRSEPRGGPVRCP